MRVGRQGQALRLFHDGRCGLCADTGVALVEDHDHRTGWVRGLLCRSCNLLEPGDERAPWRRYRAMPPAAIVGAWVRYSSYRAGQDWGMVWCGRRGAWVSRALLAADHHAADVHAVPTSGAYAVSASLEAGNAEWGIE